MKKRVTIVLEVESKDEEELTEENIKEYVLYDLDSVPRSVKIISYQKHPEHD